MRKETIEQISRILLFAGGIVLLFITNINDIGIYDSIKLLLSGWFFRSSFLVKSVSQKDTVQDGRLDCIRALLIEKKARLKEADTYILNQNMQIESSLLRKEIDALEEEKRLLENK